MWYKNIRSALESIGYRHNDYDSCVFNKTNDTGVQCTIGIYVDDLMVTSESAALLDELENHLRKTYGTITVKCGDVIDYVGMTSNFSKQGTVKVTMSHCVQDILTGCGVEGTPSTPAT